MTAAAIPVVDLRADAVRAGTVAWDGPDVSTGWHRHPYHQIEYALCGVADVETESGRFLVPPNQAIWIPAGLPHATTLVNMRSVAVFFAPEMVAGRDDRARVLPAAPVVREMIAYGTRWPISRPLGEDDQAAEIFFGALAHIVTDWLDAEVPLWLPTSDDPLIAAVMRYTTEHLATIDLVSLCREIGVSERTLRRRFEASVGMSWREYVRQSRLLRAMGLLMDRNRTVSEIAFEVGFESLSGFERAFRTLTGELPTSYRRRV